MALNSYKIYYKDRRINEDGMEQHLILTFSLKYQNYQQSIRGRQIDRVRKLVDKHSKLHKKNANDPKRFIIQEHCSPDGEMTSKTLSS